MTFQSRLPLCLAPVACLDDLRFIYVNFQAFVTVEYCLTWPKEVSQVTKKVEFGVLELIPAKIVACNLICNLVLFRLHVMLVEQNVIDIEIP